MSSNNELKELLIQEGLGDLNVKGDILPEQWYEKNPRIEEDLHTFLTKKIRIRTTVGCGYYPDNNDSVPIPKILVPLIQLLVEVKVRKKRTFREALELVPGILEKDSRVVTGLSNPGSLSLFFTKIEQRLGVKEKETSAERLKRIREKRIAENGGKQVRHYSREVKRKRELSKELTETAKELKRIKAREKALKSRIAKKAKELGVNDDP